MKDVFWIKHNLNFHNGQDRSIIKAAFGDQGIRVYWELLELICVAAKSNKDEIVLDIHYIMQKLELKN